MNKREKKKCVVTKNLITMANITDYFKSVKSFEGDEVSSSNNKTIAEQFYEKELQKPKCQKKQCIDMIVEMCIQLEEIEKKCEKRKEQINFCRSIIEEKETKISSLRNLIENGQPRLDPLSVFRLPKQTLNFTAFSQFTEEQLADIRLVGSKKNEDSKFVSVVVRNLYQGRLDILATKSITGRSRNGEKKEILTPENVDVIRRMFKERMVDLEVEEAERTEREKKINKFIKDAQVNITKSVETSHVARQLFEK